MSSQSEQDRLIDRREAIRRVSMMLGGVALVGETALLTGCRDEGDGTAATSGSRFSAEDIAFLDEVAETILPETGTPGAKAAHVGALMALIVTDSYSEPDQKIFREGMRKLDEEARRMHDRSFMEATPQQRLALLQRLDREQKEYTDRREERRRADRSAATADSAQADAYLPDQRQENAAKAPEASSAPAITADAPSHYFRMMKELALLGYFTSEIGYTRAMRYAETPGRFDPCVPYTPGETAWAPHA